MKARPGAYILCSTPRTGSTLLCSLLTATGMAGVPASYFRVEDIDRRADQMGIRSPDGAYRFADYVRAVIAQGRTPNGVFGMRVMWGTTATLVGEMRREGVEGTDVDVLTRAFGRMRFVYLRRLDVVAQAVSRHRAESTRIWHVSSADSSPAKRVQARYDRAAIKGFVDEAQAHNRAWRRWFDRNGVIPLVITYEELDLDHTGTTGRVLDFLDLESPDVAAEVPNVRMADATSRAWIERFRAETGAEC